jgi:hypothetical protein
MSNASVPALDQDAVATALRRATNLMVRKHRALGLPIVEGVGDDVVYLNPETLEEIPAAEVDAFIAKAQGRVPQAERGSDDLANEARALLRLAALREEIPVERARAFAAAMLAQSDPVEPVAQTRGEGTSS